MILDNHQNRELRKIKIESEFTIVGGGLAGVCAALSAARQGVQVTLIQDRPVLGGNASSEVRLWILGATSSGGSNNRWSREGGIVDEILCENYFRNKEGNSLFIDTLLLEKVFAEKNIHLLLNTAVHEVKMKDEATIQSVTGFNSQNSTMYEVTSKLFLDSSGDGILGFLSGAIFRMGAESKDEFGEGFAPPKEFGELLGHSIYFYAKDLQKKTTYSPPAFALSIEKIKEILAIRQVTMNHFGCNLWWIEYGGRMNTIDDSEFIKLELWKVVYGLWNFIKNSGEYPEAENYTLEWVGNIPGKRESRRFEGEYIMKQQDIVQQNNFSDAISYGGWCLDLHPADGVYNKTKKLELFYAKGIYQIPLRSLFSKNIENLFLGGRIISASHVAFGSTRVMATCALNGQAVGYGASRCIKNNWMPKHLLEEKNILSLQESLLSNGHFIPGLKSYQKHDLSKNAKLSVSSSYSFHSTGKPKGQLKLIRDWAQMIPFDRSFNGNVEIIVTTVEETELNFKILKSKNIHNFTPELEVLHKKISLPKGQEQKIKIDLNLEISQSDYLYFIFEENEHIFLSFTEEVFPGVLSLIKKINQKPELEYQLDSFTLWNQASYTWVKISKEYGKNIYLNFSGPTYIYEKGNLNNSINRPYGHPNCWLPDPDKAIHEIKYEWDNPIEIRELIINLDTNFDAPLHSIYLEHEETISPLCLKSFEFFDESGQLIAHVDQNIKSNVQIKLSKPVKTKKLIFKQLKYWFENIQSTPVYNIFVF